MNDNSKVPQPAPEEPQPSAPPAAPTAEELADLRRKAADHDQLMDRLKRVTADYLNSQKRLERRAEERAAYAIESFARELLPVVDDLARAIKAAREHHPDGTVSAGLDLVEKHL
jgi:molecular chaperone GrpE